jgi:hypothetical protein
MTVNLPSLTTLRQWAHDLMSIVGILVLAYGGVTTILADNSWIHLSVQQSEWLTAAGAIILGASKGLNVLGGLLGINATPTTANNPAPAAPPGPAA